MSEVFDISGTVPSDADHLTADDLLSGPRVVQVTGLKMRSDKKRPVAIYLSGGLKPWLPCKTMRKLLMNLFKSTNIAPLKGRYIRLYRDETVTYSGLKDPGVRLSAMSGMSQAETHHLPLNRHQKKAWKVVPLDPPKTIEQALQDAGLTPADFDAWAAANGRPPLAQMNDQQKGNAARWLSSPQAVEAVRGAGGGE